jgi:uncharacterized protein (TIGR02246 family)
MLFGVKVIERFGLDVTDGDISRDESTGCAMKTTDGGKGSVGSVCRRNVLRAAALAALVACGSRLALASEEGSPEAKDAVESVVQAFVRAWNRHDVDTLTHLFAPKGNFTSPSGAGATNRSGIRDLLAREHREIFRESTLDAKTRQVTYPSGRSAEAVGHYTLSGIPVAFGIEVAREGSFHFELERRDGEWLIQSARIAKQ